MCGGGGLSGDPDVWLGAGKAPMGGGGTRLINGRRADEGTIPKGPLPIASEELHEREHRATTDAATPFIPRVRPRGEFAALPGEIKI